VIEIPKLPSISTFGYELLRWSQHQTFFADSFVSRQDEEDSTICIVVQGLMKLVVHHHCHSETLGAQPIQFKVWKPLSAGSLLGFYDVFVDRVAVESGAIPKWKMSVQCLSGKCKLLGIPGQKFVDLAQGFGLKSRFVQDCLKEQSSFNETKLALRLISLDASIGILRGNVEKLMAKRDS